MEEKVRSEYVKRSQKDYSMSFKLQVVQEVERGEISASAAALLHPGQSHGCLLA